MCTLAIAIKEHEDYPFVLMGNRDEFFKRPTGAMEWWNSIRFSPRTKSDILAGKDLEAGGTWMGITPAGRFAAITNFRDLRNTKEDAPSRGNIVTSFLESDVSPVDFMTQLKESGPRYNGFNLLFGTVDNLHYYSNYGKSKTEINSGIHGISNAFLNDPWPKVKLAKERLGITLKGNQLNSGELMHHLGDQQEFDQDLPDTGVSKEFEKKLSAICIVTPEYGSRVSTTILVHKSGAVQVNELNRLTGVESEFTFELMKP